MSVVRLLPLLAAGCVKSGAVGHDNVVTAIG